MTNNAEYKILDFKLKEANNSKVYYNGSSHPTKHCGLLEIIGKIDCVGYRYLCRFNDGTLVDASASVIKRGEVKNPNQPSVHGVGFLGDGEWKSSANGKKTREYALWNRMMSRCYDINFQQKCSTYKDCTVYSRWHNFQNFCEDIKLLDGYNEWIKPDSKYQLDKDIKITGNRIYSIDTCTFVTQSNNIQASKYTLGNVYIATRLSDGYSEEFTNQAEFARAHNLSISNVNKCIKGRYKSCGGWTFKIKDEIGL